MSENQPIDFDSPAARTHLEIVQGVINRMAENSRSCKVWCVTLVAATLILVARTGEPQHALIALTPTLLFLFLDTYYLALERAFRDSYNAFVAKMHQHKLTSSEVYRVVPMGMGWKLFARSLGSVSIWMFYALVTVTIVLAWLLVIPSDSSLARGRL